MNGGEEWIGDRGKEERKVKLRRGVESEKDRWKNRMEEMRNSKLVELVLLIETSSFPFRDRKNAS